MFNSVKENFYYILIEKRGYNRDFRVQESNILKISFAIYFFSLMFSQFMTFTSKY